jgi:hypothetical protein
MQAIDSTSQLIVATTVITGVELTIKCNNIYGFHEIYSAGQTTPMVLGIGAVIRVVYVWKFNKAAHEVAAVILDPSGGYNTVPQSGAAYQPDLGHRNPPPSSISLNDTKPTAWDSLPGAARRRVVDFGDNPNYHLA